MKKTIGFVMLCCVIGMGIGGVKGAIASQVSESTTKHEISIVEDGDKVNILPWSFAQRV